MIFNFFVINETPLIITNIITLLLCLAVTFYGVYGYKIPHGNLLRYVILLFALALAAEIFVNQGISKVCLILTLLACVLSAYTAGRLGKRKEAIVLFSLVAAFLIAFVVAERFAPVPRGIMNDLVPPEIPENVGGLTPPPIPLESGENSFTSLCFSLSRLLLWIVIGGAYLTRYEQHKDAGKVN